MKLASLLATVLVIGSQSSVWAHAGEHVGNTDDTPQSESSTVEYKSSTELTDAEKNAIGMPTDWQIEAVTESVDMYEYYNNVLGILEQQRGYTPAQKLNLVDLREFAGESCAYLGYTDRLTDQGVSHLAAGSRVEKIRTVSVDEQTGAAIALGVYYRCPQYMDTIHDWAYQPLMNK